MTTEVLSRDENAATAGVTAPAVALRGITKSFPGVRANDDISLDFWPGEVHVLLGENGAGKSTLIGMLAGLQQPDAGEIRIGGRPVRIGSPRESLALGIGVVFQHMLLVQSLTVLENLMLGGAAWRRLDRPAALARFRELSDMLGIALAPDVPVERLSLGEQQQVEILRALWRGGRVLILDEPTSMLTPQGVRELGQVMRRLRDQQVAIVFVTHKLQEAYAFGDSVSVLRLGRLVGRLPRERLATLSEQAMTDEVIRLMFGSDGARAEEKAVLAGQSAAPEEQPQAESVPPSLQVRALSTMAEPGECAIRDIAFEVRPGEVLGIAGVDGNGQKHLAEALAGQRPAASGEILLDGTPITAFGASRRRRCGISYITDERLGEGTVGSLPVATNLVMKQIGAPPFWHLGVSLWGRINAHAREQIIRHDIRTPSERTPVGRLSGGNIQKVLLARELSDRPRVVIFSKPTYGLDLQNTRLARQRIRDAAKSGCAIIVISTELDELLELCHRIGVLFRGHMTGIVENSQGAEHRIGMLMTGTAA